MYKIVASIVLFKNSEVVLKEAIQSFLNTTLNVKIVLVDNSPDDNLKKMSSLDSRIDYIFNNSNVGFGAAHNVAIKKYVERCQYFLVLNPDIYFSCGQLENMVEFMDKNKFVGHLMPKVLYPDNSVQFICKKIPTFFDLFARAFLPSILAPMFENRLKEFDYRDKDYDKTMYNVPYLSGCFMFLRSATLQQVGYFDERIFMYLEDADLTRRFLEVSQTIYFPGAVIYHHFAKGTYKSLRLMMYTIHGGLIYLWKWRFKKLFIYKNVSMENKVGLASELI